MKKYLAIILSLLLVLMGMSACADNTGQNNNNNSNNNGGGTTPPVVTTENVLIAYFSCTGTTESIAQLIAEETGGTLHEIQPAVPYTEEDLDYYSGGRADREQTDPTARPAIANSVQNIQACLDRLNIGYVDMMLLHHPDTNDVKAYKAMEQFVESGQIRSLGLSNWYIEEIDDFIAQVNIMPALVQNEIHIYYQEQDVVPYMHNLGIVVQAWYPFGGRGHTGEILNDPTIVSIAEAHDRTAAQVILRWHLQRGVVAIPGSSNPDHIRENISVFDFSLTEDEMAAIAALDRGEKHDWY